MQGGESFVHGPYHITGQNQGKKKKKKIWLELYMIKLWFESEIIDFNQ